MISLASTTAKARKDSWRRTVNHCLLPIRYSVSPIEPYPVKSDIQAQELRPLRLVFFACMKGPSNNSDSRFQSLPSSNRNIASLTRGFFLLDGKLQSI